MRSPPWHLAAAVLGLAACGSPTTAADTNAETETTADPKPMCPFEQLVDVHFVYHTDSELEADTCTLDFLGPPGSDAEELLIATDCGYQVELDGVSLPVTELSIGDTITLETRVDDPAPLACAESGWLVIHDPQDRMQLAVASVLASPTTIPLGDLGEVELTEVEVEGCAALELRAGDEAVHVLQATSTDIELMGVELRVKLGPFRTDSSVGCPPEHYSVALIRLPG